MIVEWFRKAAESGDAESQFNLAAMLSSEGGDQVTSSNIYGAGSSISQWYAMIMYRQH
jgi:TPR repeat protein